MNTKSTKLRVAPGLSLITTVLTQESPVKRTPKPTNRIAIIDRSGSMGWTLDKVVEDLYRWACSIPRGDTITIGWFSSPKQYRFVLKGASIMCDADIANVRKILDACKTTIGSTCFSEIMCDLAQVVNDLTPISDRFAMMFFTDGCPVVSDVKAEIAAIERNLRVVHGAIDNSIFVGYGDYYNRNLMADMARWTGGALIHADTVERFSEEFKAFTTNSIDTNPGVEVGIGKDPQRIASFVISGKNPVAYEPSIETIRVSASKDEQVIVYSLTADTQGPHRRMIDETEMRGLYAASVVLTRINRGDTALDIVGFLGDVYFANKLVSSYTNAEIGNVEAMLSDAIVDVSKRFVGGRQMGCVPDRNAFCVLDALEVLVDDEEANFYPLHPLFRYKRIGVKSEIAEGFAKFKADDSIACPMNTLIMNESRPNLSIQTKIFGTIDLGEDATKHGLAREFPTFQFKNYTIVRDGALNVTVMPCSVSSATFSLFVSKGLIDPMETYEPGKIYAINVGALPVMNRGMAEQYKSGRKVAANLLHLYELQGKVKALKFYKDKLDPGKKTAKPDSLLNEAAVSFLEQRGVGRNGYAPSVVRGEATDSYIAKEFNIAGKGFSSFPKVEEVVDRRNNKKKQTTSGEMVLKGVELYESIVADIEAKIQRGAIVIPKGKTSNDLFALALAQELKKLDQDLRSTRRCIQAAKFAVLLGNQWFEEFSSREDCKLVVDDVEFTFAVREVVEQI